MAYGLRFTEISRASKMVSSSKATNLRLAAIDGITARAAFGAATWPPIGAKATEAARLSASIVESGCEGESRGRAQVTPRAAAPRP